MDRPHRMGKPVRHAGPFLLKSLLPVALAATLAACDNQPDEKADSKPPAAAAEQATETAEALKAPEAATPTKAERQAALRKLGETMREPKRDLRVIGGGRLPVPPIPEEGLVRLSPSESAEEKNARQKARIPEKPDLFPRPIVVQAGELRSGDTLIHLAGIEPLPKEKRCKTERGNWPCGNFARAALQRFIRSRTISCSETAGTAANGEHYSGHCRIGKTDLSQWLVSQGWATASGSDLKDAEREAQKAEKGIWRKQIPSF